MLIRYFAAARAAAGFEQETIEIADGVELAELCTLLARQHPTSASASAPALEVLLPRCSFLRNGMVLKLQANQTTQTALNAQTGSLLANTDVIDVLPPFAGG